METLEFVIKLVVFVWCLIRIRQSVNAAYDWVNKGKNVSRISAVPKSKL